VGWHEQIEQQRAGGEAEVIMHRQRIRQHADAQRIDD
jgi:hypothetical protein